MLVLNGLPTVPPAVQRPRVARRRRTLFPLRSGRRSEVRSRPNLAVPGRPGADVYLRSPVLKGSGCGSGMTPSSDAHLAWRPFRQLAGWLAASLPDPPGGVPQGYVRPAQVRGERSLDVLHRWDLPGALPIPGTVARDELHLDIGVLPGQAADGKVADSSRWRSTATLIELGRDRYLVYCPPCHGGLGDGRGMVVRRGFSPPPSFHARYLRKIPVGHFFDVITNGYGAMYSYAAGSGEAPMGHRRLHPDAAVQSGCQSRNLTPAQQKVLADADRSTNPDESRRLAEVKK